MRITFALLFLSFIPAMRITAQEACTDQTIMNVTGHWKKTSDANMIPDKNQSQVNSRIDNISKLFQEAYPNPKGNEAIWYRTMADPMLKNLPLGYSFNALFKAWYCNTNVNKLLLGDETGTWAYVFVNEFSWLMSNQYDRQPFTINGLYVYKLPRKKGSWKGYPLYESSSHSVRGCIVLTRPDQLPWKPITRDQYLKALRADYDEKAKHARQMYYKRDSSSRKSIIDIQNNKYLKPEDKEKIIAGLQKDYLSFQQTRAKDSARQVSYWMDKVTIIDNYTSRSNPQELQEPAFVKEYADFPDLFTAEEKGGISLVTVNSSYFNKQLPTYIPQMMVLYWRWENNAPSKDFKKQFETNFPIEKLQAMIDH